MMNDETSREEEVFFNPFQKLRRELAKKAPVAPLAPPPSAPEAKKKPLPRAGEADDDALFLQAVSSPSFKPMKDATPRRRPGKLERSGQADSTCPASLAEPPAPAEPSPPRQARPEPARPGNAAKGEPAPPSTGELALFAAAMHGVKPVDGKGRDLAPPRPEPKITLAENHDYLQEFLQGKVEFALEYTDEFFEGHVMGLDPLVLAKLRAGQYSPEAHIDLHGQNAEQAQEALATFIRHSYNKGQRSLVVVTGRGKNSPGGLGILRQHMQDWLTRDPLKRAVLAFCTAQPKDGGAGALYVLLRKYKKSGKIRWDRSNWPPAEA